LENDDSRNNYESPAETGHVSANLDRMTNRRLSEIHQTNQGETDGLDNLAYELQKLGEVMVQAEYDRLIDLHLKGCDRDHDPSPRERRLDSRRYRSAVSGKVEDRRNGKCRSHNHRGRKPMTLREINLRNNGKES
jgi:hypothetical protein